MIDLVCVVADRQIEAAISGLLDRPSALGIRRIEKEILRHPGRDPGCYFYPTEILRGYRQSAEHALIIFDHAWEGRPTGSAADFESNIVEKFRREGMEDWAVPVVIEPELEAWVFSASRNVDQILGWRNRNPDLREALEQQSFWKPGDPKPGDPKEALDWALREVKKPRDSSIFRDLARRVSTKSCQDRAFRRLRGLLQDWFPPSSSGNGRAGGDGPVRNGYKWYGVPREDQEEAHRGRITAGRDQCRQRPGEVDPAWASEHAAPVVGAAAARGGAGGDLRADGG